MVVWYFVCVCWGDKMMGKRRGKGGRIGGWAKRERKLVK